MSDLNSPVPPTQPSQRPVTPAPVTSGDSTAQGQTPRHSDGQPLPQEQQPTPNPAVTLSASLAGMSAGKIVEAVVLGADADGVPVIRAAGGTFLAVAQDALAPHAQLILKIQSTGHEVRALVTSVNGELQHPPSEISLLLTNVSGGAAGGPAAAPAVETYSAPIGGARPASQTPGQAQPLAPGLLLTAQVVPAPLAAAALLGGDLTASAPNEPAAGASPFRVGTPLLVRIISVGSNTGSTAPPATLGAATPGAATLGAATLGAATPGAAPLGATPGSADAAAPQGPSTQGPSSLGTGSQGVPAAGPTAAATPGPAQNPGPNTPPARPQASGARSPQAHSAQPTQLGASAPGGSAANQTQAAAAGNTGNNADQPQAAPRPGTPSVGPSVGPSLGPAVAAASTAPAHPLTLNGVVAEPTADGHTLVKTPVGVFQFGAALVAEAGVDVTMEVQLATAGSPGGGGGASPGVTPAAAPASPQTVLADFTTGWSALRELMQFVQAVDPGIASQFAAQRLPSHNARATNNILFFLSALRGGDVRGWLGADMTRAAERAGQRRLIDRLGEDFSQLRALIDADDETEWRAAPFPFFDGKEIEPVNMFIRGRRPKKEDGEDDVRFVVQFELSALGAMQLDGLLRQQNFDLIVRSRTGLSEQVRQDISALFNGAIEATGLKGDIVFQNVETFPVSPFSDLFGVEHPAGNVVV